MKKYIALLMLVGCTGGRQEKSDLNITKVVHTAPKNQAIGNCWLYAQATWLESLYASTHGEDKAIDVSETYWTYWSLYDTLLREGKEASHPDENKRKPLPTTVSTGGTWDTAAKIIAAHGWLEQESFIPNDVTTATETIAVNGQEKTLKAGTSKSEFCAESYLANAIKAGGELASIESRTPENIHKHLGIAFSCNKPEKVIDINVFKTLSHTSDSTLLSLPGNPTNKKNLSYWLRRWENVVVPNTLSPFNRPWSNAIVTNREADQAKKLIPQATMIEFTNLEKRIKTALNAHQPVILYFATAATARTGIDKYPNNPEKYGWELDGVSKVGERGKAGGHMIVLDDFTVLDVEGIPNKQEDQQGDRVNEFKRLAMKDNSLDFLLIKNSWGESVKTELKEVDGVITPVETKVRTSARLSWEFLTSRYLDASSEDTNTSFFLSGLVFPPGY